MRRMRTGGSRRAFGLVVAVAALVALLAGCTPLRTPLWAASGQDRYGAAFLTREGVDDVSVQSIQTGVRTQALPTNEGGNTRMLFWPEGVERATDAESCATWDDRQGASVQQGAALRVTRAGGRVRAITVTQNIAFGAGWVFNVHTWDTQRAGAPWSQVGRVDLSPTFFSRIRPLPWSFCARVIGDVVEMKLWDADDEAEPRWGDPAHGGAVTLPAGWRTPGQAGWYIGHLRAGDHADFVGTTTWTYDPRPSSARVTATG